MNLLQHIADRLIARNAPDRSSAANALAQVAHLQPATLVTGGSRGIGFALAEKFARERGPVVIVAREPAPLAKAAGLIAARAGRPAVPIALDITASDAPTILQQKLSETGFYADILINNAAMGLAGCFHESHEQDLAQLVSLNVSALTALTRAFLPSMLARGRGGLLNVASLGGAVPGPGQGAYYASKAYVLSLTEALSAEYAGRGVRIAVLAPGPVNTRFHGLMGAEGSPYRFLLPAMGADRVAHVAYQRFMWGQRVITPGAFNTVMYALVRTLPHPLTVPLVKFLLRK